LIQLRGHNLPKNQDQSNPWLQNRLLSPQKYGLCDRTIKLRYVLDGEETTEEDIETDMTIVEILSKALQWELE
jgi:hypothetical protein